MRIDGCVFIGECSCGVVFDALLPPDIYRVDGKPISLGVCHGCGREYLLSASVIGVSEKTPPRGHVDTFRGPWA